MIDSMTNQLGAQSSIGAVNSCLIQKWRDDWFRVNQEYPEDLKNRDNSGLKTNKKGEINSPFKIDDRWRV